MLPPGSIFEDFGEPRTSNTMLKPRKYYEFNRLSIFASDASSELAKAPQSLPETLPKHPKTLQRATLELPRASPRRPRGTLRRPRSSLLAPQGSHNAHPRLAYAPAWSKLGLTTLRQAKTAKTLEGMEYCSLRRCFGIAKNDIQYSVFAYFP